MNRRNFPRNRTPAFRGQFFSADLMFASVAVVALAAITVFAFSRADSAQSQDELRSQLSASASDALAALVQSPGNPSNWTRFGKMDSAQISGIGLASSPGVLDYDKVSFFFSSINRASANANYSNASMLMGLRKAGYDFSVSIYDSSGATLFSTNASAQPSQNNSASAERLALLNATPVRARISVWTTYGYFGS